MKIFLIAMLLCSSASFACREGVLSEWPKSEEYLIGKSEWIKIIEIVSVKEKFLKNIYNYKVVRQLKGKVSENELENLGPFPISDNNVDAIRLIWKDKACVQHINLEVGKKYILFSILNNLNSIQIFNLSNEERITKILRLHN